MTTTYTPKGAVIAFIEAVKADPHRVWSSPEAAEVMKIQNRKVSATLKYAVLNGVLYKGQVWGAVAYSGMPFDRSQLPKGEVRQPRRKRPDVKWEPSEDDVRIPRVVPGWVPPKMVCVREVSR